MQAYTIGLPINEDIKLEKGKEKNSSAALRFMRSLSHVSLCNSASTIIYIYCNPPFSTSPVIIYTKSNSNKGPL